MEEVALLSEVVEETQSSTLWSCLHFECLEHVKTEMKTMMKKEKMVEEGEGKKEDRRIEDDVQ